MFRKQLGALADNQPARLSRSSTYQGTNHFGFHDPYTKSRGTIYTPLPFAFQLSCLSSSLILRYSYRMRRFAKSWIWLVQWRYRP